MLKFALLFSLLWAGSLQDYVASSSYQSSSSSSDESETFSQSSISTSSSLSSSTASSIRRPKPPRCPVNETYSPNGSPCPPDSCESINTSYDCLEASEKPNVAGCICKDGYLRSGKNCVKSEECPPQTPTCGQNEHYEVDTIDCETSCADKDVDYVKQCERSEPFTGCMCDNGFYRNEEGQCVAYEACNNCTGINEEPNDCGSLCATTCKNRHYNKAFCPAICIKGCFCVNGTLRHDNGTCVPVEECSPPECNSFEYYTTCGTCEVTCDNYNQTRVCTKECKQGCYCKDGLIRSPNGIDCVKPENCPKPICGQNEHYEVNTIDCETPCAGKDVYYFKKCERSEPFTGCMCDNGFYRNEEGQCVSYESCYNCTGINEEYNCERCAQTCKTRHLVKGFCPEFCIKGCYCVDGTLRHDNGTCVPVAECSPPECNSFEYYTNCGTCEVTCDNYNKTRVCTKECKRGCYCKDGLIRAPNGIDCVKPEKCPKPSCGQNEHYENNTLDCETTCANKDVRYIKKCERNKPFTGCMCDNGFYRNDQGKCVAYKQCPVTTCKGVNEKLSTCASGCDQTCDTRIRNNNICTDICLRKCVCVDGTLRHSNGTCVPVYQCSPPICNKDEYYTTCGGCETSCDNLNNTCLACTANCREGCYCNKGLIRGTDGISCVKPESCPKPICVEHELWSECPDNCFTGKCQDIWSKYNCTKAPKCCAPKCVCESGRFRNSKGICITGQECIQRNGE